MPKKYREEENFRLSVKNLLALAFVPIDNILAGFDLVAAEFDGDSVEFIDNFEETWIGEPKKEANDIL